MTRWIALFLLLICTLQIAARPLEIPPAVQLTPNLTFRPGQTLDVWLPREPQSPLLPVLLNIHGGAFKAGDKTGGMEQVLPLVATGKFAAVSFDYRLSSQAQWPAQLEDCEAAVAWIRRNGAAHHLDSTRIGVVGHTAGGTLAALLGVDGPAGDVGVAGVVNLSGPTDFTQLPTDGSKLDHTSAASPEGKLFGGELASQGEKVAQASAINWVAPGGVPFLLLHGDQDPVIPQVQSKRFYKRLQTAGIEVYFVNVRNGGHGDFKSPEIARRIEAFFSKVLLHQETPVSEEDIVEK